MAKERYFLGPDLLRDIRRTVTRIETLPERLAEGGQEPRLQELNRRPRLVVGKSTATLLPQTTAVFTLHTGEPGEETATPQTTKAYIRHTALHTGSYATIGLVDGDLEVIEGGFSLRPARYNSSEEWLHDQNMSVTFLTGGEVTVTNIVASVPKWTDERKCLVMYENDKYTGQARWGLVSADTYYTRRATYDATEQWKNSAKADVTLVNGGGEVEAVNYGPTVAVWGGTARDCVVSYEDGDWVLHEAETYYTRRATYDSGAEWLTGTEAKVDLFNGGGQVTAVNYGPSIGKWESQRNCVVSYEDDKWVLHEAETYYVRRGTFSGTWAKNATKTVTLTNGGSVTADNLFGDVGVAAETRNCAVAYEDGTWFLIAAECT